MARDVETEVERIYEQNDGSASVSLYHDAHDIRSLLILTITNRYAAMREVDQFAAHIRGKVVIEIGAGVGLLAIEMAKFASHVYAIEADPAWSWAFTNCLYECKPPNLTFIFGAAETVSGWLRGDVAVVFTRSGKEAMYEVARKMCPKVITGPRLSLRERNPDVADEILDEAERDATNYTVDDLTLRGLKKLTNSKQA